MSGRRQWGNNDSTVSVKLSAGSSVTLIFKGNLFDLTREERVLIGSLSAVIQQWQNGNGSGSVNEKTPENIHE